MANPHTALTCALAAALSMCCIGAAAQTYPSTLSPARFFTYENDTWFNTDRSYTSGVQLSVKRAGDRRGDFARRWTGPLCDAMGCSGWPLLSSQINAGQLIYTPSDITIGAPQPLDRPWAAMLYYEQAYSFLAPDQRTLTTLTAQAGVTGPLALGEPAQKLLHRVFDRPQPAGWGNAIGGSLAVMATAERRSALDALSANLGGGVRMNSATYWRLAAGNILTYAAGGIAVVVGKDLPAVSPPPPGIGNKIANNARIPALTSCLTPWLQCTAFASAEARIVGYNLFLDGRLFHDDPQVRRRKLVADLVVGLRFDLPRTRTRHHGAWFVQLKSTRRSPEFKGAVKVPWHRVAAVTIGTEF